MTDRIAVLTFTRPPANWMSIAAMTELADALDEIAGRTSDVTAVVLTGGVDGYFHRPRRLGRPGVVGPRRSCQLDPPWLSQPLDQPDFAATLLASIRANVA